MITELLTRVHAISETNYVKVNLRRPWAARASARHNSIYLYRAVNSLLLYFVFGYVSVSTEKFSFNYNNIYIINQISVFKIYSVLQSSCLSYTYLTRLGRVTIVWFQVFLYFIILKLLCFRCGSRFLFYWVIK